MGEGFVGLRHFVCVFAFLDRCTAIVGGIKQFARKTFDHGIFGAFAGGVDYPTDGQGLPAFWADFHGDLIGCAANPSGT